MKDPITVLEDAHTAMELFDLAMELVGRVRGSPETLRRAMSISEKCRLARNSQLRTYDAAKARLRNE